MQTQGEQRVSAGESCGSLGTLPSEKGFNQQLLTGRARRKNERFVHSTDFSHSLGHADNSPDPLPCLMAQIGLLPPATHSPGRESPRNIFISLCCDPEACDHQEIPQAHQRCWGWRTLSPLPARAGFSSALWSPWLLPRRRHGVFRPKWASFTRIKGI